MCAQPNSPPVTSNQSNEKLSVNQNSNRSKNKHSRGEKRNSTPQQSGSAQKPNNESRNAKRARWAKKMRPQQKPVVHKGPEHEYISACCLVPARKPRAGAKVDVRDPETGRTKSQPKGLGHWRCGQCGKVCKVTPRKPEARPTGNMANLSCPDIIYPAKLQTPVLVDNITLKSTFPIAPPGVIARIVTFGGPDMGRGTGVTVEEPKAEVV